VLQRDGFRCRYCDRSASDTSPVKLHIDHRKPVALGGTNDRGNLVTACSACNLGKGARYDTSGLGDPRESGPQSNELSGTRQ
jgi:5-methylcytosine-specific restriction endonuclease McrA